MKIVVGIVASENYNYTAFKEVWIKSIVNVKQNAFLKDIFDFYFLYSDKDGESRQIQFVESSEVLYTDFYDNCDYSSITKSILMRTGKFFTYIKSSLNLTNQEIFNVLSADGYYFVRTNLSTLFQYTKLLNWLESKPRVSFFGGSFNGFYNNLNTTISGTNFIFSLDVLLYVSMHYNNLDLSYCLEDEAISQLIIRDLNTFIINIKRLDFIEMDEVILPTYTWPATPNSIVYHKTIIGDKDIFSFRFKTFDRRHDVSVMKTLVDAMELPVFDLTKFVTNVKEKHNLVVSSEAPTYGKLFSEQPFKIINLF